MSSKSEITPLFGKGGVAFATQTGGKPDLGDLLRELQVVTNAALKTWNKDAADAAANTATAEVAVHIVKAAPSAGVIGASTPKVFGLSFVPSAALVADATNNATLTVYKRRAGVQSVLGTLTTDVAGGSWTAWIAKALTLTATLTDLVLADGDVITVAITKGGTGVAVPAGTLLIDIDAA